MTARRERHRAHEGRRHRDQSPHEGVDQPRQPKFCRATERVVGRAGMPHGLHRRGVGRVRLAGLATRPSARGALVAPEALRGGAEEAHQDSSAGVARWTVRNQFGYYIGHTGRWAGRGVQTQNLAKPDKTVEDRVEEITNAIRNGAFPPDLDPSLALTSTVRSSFRATDGHCFWIVDLASIESRVLAWLSNCQPLLAVFREGRDPYKDFAVVLNKIPYDQVTKQQRTEAKPGVLGAGYQMGADRLADYAGSMGITMTVEQARLHIQAFRSAYKEIPALWVDLERHAIGAVQDRKEYRSSSGLTFDGRNQLYLRIGLPSSRSLYYLKPSVVIAVNPWGDKEELFFERAQQSGPDGISEDLWRLLDGERRAGDQPGYSGERHGDSEP
jgi:hypothetical protein